MVAIGVIVQDYQVEVSPKGSLLLQEGARRSWRCCTKQRSIRPVGGGSMEPSLEEEQEEEEEK